MSRLKVLHLINPYAIEQAHGQALMQLTLQSIEEAAKCYPLSFDLHVLAVTNNKDNITLSAFFDQRPTQLRTLQDIDASFARLSYPLMQDLLNCALAETFDYLIYTNMDIILMPHFYRYLEAFIPSNDAIVINRRRVADRELIPSLALLQAELGWSHPGFDCFVLQRSLVAKLQFEEICIGVPFLESAFTHHIAAYARNPLYVLDAHLTLHVGLEVLPKVHRGAYWHNRAQFFKKIHPALGVSYRQASFPYANEKPIMRLFKWMLNPSLYTRTYLKLEFNSKRKRWQMRLQALRWKFLQR